MLSSCKATLNEIQSTRQRWCVDEKNLAGINYHFTLKSMADGKHITFDSLYIHGQWLKNFHFSVIGKSNTETVFHKGDTVLLSINQLDTLYSQQKIVLNYSFKKKSKQIYFSRFKELKNLCK